MATILVVDDEPDILELIRVNLELDGHEVLTSSGGAEALDRIHRRPPDLILLDVSMPGVDGWTVLSQIKAESDLDVATIPVLMVTARTAPQDRIRGGIEGALRYLTKPFDPCDLRVEVRDALEGEPEPVRRQRARKAALEQLARAEKGLGGMPAAPEDRTVRPRITRLEHRSDPPVEPPNVRVARQNAVQLSDKQRQLLATLEASSSVSEAATRLQVSRSNVYASLRRIGRKLGTRSVSELLALVRAGDVPVDHPPAG